ncbi:DEAD/DEAH box helicase [Aliarcobacter butzleri]|uniref:DEAD/DEAH box helicase n=1 Tax=Aliarcobacter butzleri TaxID=28197 RepID=UPI00263C90D0|nr:AAA domain-containing protein [Aliarcobacter butzleri]MDN5069045.1 AAA domain-containing protein [Aliarcobacter butzleri]MDN5079588.1 AAA domain-containing protein [Aliarcobacter butzleri]
MPHIEPAHSLLTDPNKLTKKIKLSDNLVENLLNKVNSLTKFPLNNSQQEAFINTFDTPLTLIWGPPGTGKTDTLSKILIGWLMRTDKPPMNILIGSNNYNAIDNIMKKFYEQIEIPDSKFYRIRSSGREKLELTSLIDINTTTQSDCTKLYNELETRNQNNIVATTWKQIINISKKGTSSKVNNLNKEWFDLIIIDEASQVPVSSAMGYFILAKKDCHFILAGDPKQLGPIYSYKIEEKNYLYDCIFTYYSEKFNIEPNTLNTTYRSNNPITMWPAERFYKNNYISYEPKKCLNHKIQIKKEKPTEWPDDLFWHSCLYSLCDPQNPISILIHDDKVSTLSNSFESDIITALTYLYKTIYSDFEDKIFWNNQLGIVTPHRAQVSTIKNKIASLFNYEESIIAVDSVDKFQGDEREIILSSYSVSDKDFIQAEEEFILNAKRFNVTLTRAKSKFILVISKSMVEYISGDIKIAEDASHLQMFITKYCNVIESHKIEYTNQGEKQFLDCIIKGKSF